MPEPALTLEQQAERDQAVHTLGNLTLTTRSLNGSLSNRPWTDVDAAWLKEGGLPGQGKRSLLNEFSLLAITKDLVAGHPGAWTDQDITDRSVELTKQICEIWDEPPAEFRSNPGTLAHDDTVLDDDDGEADLTDIPWTQDELRTFMAQAGVTTRSLIRHLALNPDVPQTVDEVSQGTGLSVPQVRGTLGAIGNITAHRWHRSNPVVSFVQRDGRWLSYLDGRTASLVSVD